MDFTTSVIGVYWHLTVKLVARPDIMGEQKGHFHNILMLRRYDVTVADVTCLFLIDTATAKFLFGELNSKFYRIFCLTSDCKYGKKEAQG